MTAFFLVLLLFFAYGVLCLLAPAKHLAFSACLNRRGRRKWHEGRAYTTPYLRMQRRWSQQTPSNLWGIRATGIAFIGMSLWVMWPRPALHIPEARRTNDHIVRRANNHEWHSRSGRTPRQSGLDIAHGLILASGNGTPLVKQGIVACGGHQPVYMALLKRLQANVITSQNKIRGSHCFHYALNASSRATPSQLLFCFYATSCLITVALLYATRKPSRSALRCEVVPP